MANENFHITEYGLFFRTLGAPDNGEIIGAGFMKKNNKGWDQVNRKQDHYSLCYVISGSGKYIDHRGAEYVLKAGSFFQRIPGILHSTYIEEENTWRECFICLGKSLCDVLLKMGIINPEIPCGYAGLSRNIINVFRKIQRDIKNATDLSAGELVSDLLKIQQQIVNTEKSESSGEDNAMISLACQILSEDLDKRLDLRKMCREQGWGYEKFRKLFRKRLGVSPVQYRIRVRIDAARNLLLADKDRKISDVAYELGYPSVYEFSAQFKKNTGLPPGVFRKGFI